MALAATTGKTATLDTGNRVRVLDNGESGLPVVLLHGLANSIEIWVGNSLGAGIVVRVSERHLDRIDRANIARAMIRPTLVLWGLNDRVFPHHQSATAPTLLPDARRVLVERCGHSLHWERPEAFCEAVTARLSGDPIPQEVM
jgi:pimeloyl-ACP methyl ester carboxylesterase